MTAAHLLLGLLAWTCLGLGGWAVFLELDLRFVPAPSDAGTDSRA